jgi:DNA replication protein DnaD
MDFSSKDIDWRRILLQHYKSPAYRLSEKELVALYVIDDITLAQPTLITSDDLSSYMDGTGEELDAVLTSLLDKKDIEYVTDAEGKVVTSLKPLKDRIVENLKKDILIENNEKSVRKDQEEVNGLYTYFENQLGRPLSLREVDRISKWIRSGASEGQIKEAVERLKAKNKAVSLAAVDKILLSIQKNSDITKEGYSTMDEDHRLNDEETVNLLKKKWVS